MKRFLVQANYGGRWSNSKWFETREEAERFKAHLAAEDPRAEYRVVEKYSKNGGAMSRTRKEEVSFDRTDWEEVFYAAESKIKAIEAGFYGYEDPEGDDEEWIEQLKGACDIINSALENHEDVDTSRFSEKDWAEMYYALDSKINGIKSGFFGQEDKRGDNKKWIAHLQRLADEIERYHEV